MKDDIVQAIARINPEAESPYYKKKRCVTWYSKKNCWSPYPFEHYRMINNWSCKHSIYCIYDEESEDV